MRGITVAFSNGVALDRVDLDLHSGEVHALLGENGAGKSTLIKALLGVYPIEAGEVLVDGEPVRLGGPADARALGIQAAFQESHLVENLSVGENVMLGHEVHGRVGISWRATHERAATMLAELGLAELDPRALLADLTPASRQLVSIARAMVDRPRVLVLDEPTSSLDAVDVAQLFEVIRRLRDQGVAILFVSHFLEQVLALSDRMTILRGGVKKGDYLPHEIGRAELVARMIGKDIAHLQRIGSERRAHRVDPVGPPLYRATGVGRRGMLRPVDFELHAGEVVGIAGLRGSGRTELARLLAGADRADGGVVTLGGRTVVIDRPADALRNRVALSAEDRGAEGLINDLSVRENIVLALQALRGWAHPLSKAEREDLVERHIEHFDITPVDPATPAGELSGGNQQKVLLARWLAIRPRVLILDEPTRGVDIGAKVDIQAHVAQLALEGVAVVFISSAFDELVRVSDRIVVLKDREKIGELSNGPGVTVDTLVELIAAPDDESDEGDDFPPVWQGGPLLPPAAPSRR
ncbi:MULTISPECIES: sugar ABC transporter ATP-binding protein [unclassified Frigoribacterium]|jgi:simple sugar transport system ATP-binding protein|uniref:sugar ABC transporter ATP-binding protein n=1 Tax=unclassified Frigoribacterium TaxID=2627005 RepID=UPI001F18268A|nr:MULTISPECIES: sugar ABC transporter ATP-binding protein [unclassified Frigoribacterium]